MKTFVIACVIVCSPLFCFALRIINDSPNAIRVSTYNTWDIFFSASYRDYDIVANGSVDFVPHDKERCKLRIFVFNNGEVSTVVVRPERVFTNGDVIIVNFDLSVYATPEGTTQLYPVPTSKPGKPTYAGRLMDGQGLEHGSVSQGGYTLEIQGGRVTISTAEGACYTFPGRGVQYLQLLSGFLFFYKDAPGGGYAVIGRYGKYRPGAMLSVSAECAVRVSKNGFFEWKQGGWTRFPKKPSMKNAPVIKKLKKVK